MSTLSTNNLKSLETGRVVEINSLIDSQDVAALEADVSDRVIRVESIAAMESYSAPVGYVFSLNAGVRSGTFDVVSGDFSTELDADTYNGIYVGLSDDPTATTKVLKRRYDNVVNVQWFGVMADGSTDDTASLQGAVDFIERGVLSLPVGSIRTSGITMVNSGIILQGSGERATLLVNISATTDLISVGNASININDVLLKDFKTISEVTKTSGNDIIFVNGHNLKIQNIRIESPFVGIKFLGGAQQFLYYLENFEINNPVYQGIEVGAPSSYVQDLWVSDGVVAGAGQAGIAFYNCSGLYFSSIDVISCDKGILFYPALYDGVKGGFFSQVLADTSTQSGWDFLENGGKVTDITLNGCWSATNGDNGFRFEVGAGIVDGINLSGCISTNNSKHGILVSGVKNLNLSNSLVTSNSKFSYGTYHGLHVDADVSNWTVNGGTFGQGGSFPTNPQGYGIFVGVGLSNFYNIIGADCNGNVTGSISDGGTGFNKYIYANQGFRTNNSGVQKIPSGSSLVNFAHNLDSIPTKQDVQVSALSNLGLTGGSSLWVGATDETNITINVDASLSADFFFGWSARIKGA